MRTTFVRRTSRLLLGASLLCALPALADHVVVLDGQRQVQDVR